MRMGRSLLLLLLHLRRRRRRLVFLLLLLLLLSRKNLRRIASWRKWVSNLRRLLWRLRRRSVGHWWCCRPFSFFLFPSFLPFYEGLLRTVHPSVLFSLTVVAGEWVLFS